MPTRSTNIDDLRIDAGRLVMDVPKERLDKIIAGCDARINKINTRIAEFEAEKTDLQRTITRANTLKGDLTR
jgi:hypothetical protein